MQPVCCTPPPAASSCRRRRRRLAAQRARARSHAPRAARCAPILCRAARCRPPAPHRASTSVPAGRGAAPRSSCGPLPLRRRLRRLRLADSVICQAGGGEGSEGSAAAARDSERTRPPTPLALAAPIAATVGRTRPSFPHARACCARRSVGRRPAARSAYAALWSGAGGARPTRRATRGSPVSRAPSAYEPSRAGASAAAAQPARGGRTRPRAVLGAALRTRPQPAGTRRARHGRGDNGSSPIGQGGQCPVSGDTGEGGGSIVRRRTWG